MRTITELLSLEGRVYVYAENEAIRDQFLEQAQEEGFLFGDGILPTKRPLDTIYALNKDKTMNFLGMWGTLAFKNPSMASYVITRVDYKKYINFEEEFIF